MGRVRGPARYDRLGRPGRCQYGAAVVTSDLDIYRTANVLIREHGDEADARKNPHAVALGRLDGKKGDKARAKNLSPEERARLARKAAQRRWENQHRT